MVQPFPRVHGRQYTTSKILSLVCHIRIHRGASSSSCRGDSIYQSIDALSPHPLRYIYCRVKVQDSVDYPRYPIPSSLHLSALLNMGRVCSAESYPYPPIKVIKQTRAERFDQPPLLLYFRAKSHCLRHATETL